MRRRIKRDPHSISMGFLFIGFRVCMDCAFCSIFLYALSDHVPFESPIFVILRPLLRPDIHAAPAFSCDHSLLDVGFLPHF